MKAIKLLVFTLLVSWAVVQVSARQESVYGQDFFRTTNYMPMSAEVNMVQNDLPEDSVQIYASNGSIYVRSSKKVKVKVYTIVGSLVMETYAGPGLSELQPKSRGLYLVSAGGVTQRVTV
ncbi:hypothetical protein [uncultured Coprobacter sp.]|uniref:hypothetical protein n=1 Tax=uncultured Coprobacter sp. TaxID=1720550 RepID=UPI00262F6641|nr:hypothetical protein [uncultured Coprobacter sp.]